MSHCKHCGQELPQHKIVIFDPAVEQLMRTCDMLNGFDVIPLNEFYKKPEPPLVDLLQEAEESNARFGDVLLFEQVMFYPHPIDKTDKYVIEDKRPYWRRFEKRRRGRR